MVVFHKNPVDLLGSVKYMAQCQYLDMVATSS